ncbi:MAG: low-specificity L-threonine aldolase [Chloroflexi bacterium]|nr:low-specificity L-threonine aldolase [Chloroflexota bacterium]
MRIVDLRSDTVTLPTPAMREAIYRAEVGDDVFGEDPTVNRLEEMAAERMGKEAALYVASGTMGNLVALLTHCGRGDEFIVGHLAHTFLYEAGGSAALGGVHPRTVPNQPDGTLDLADVEAAIRAENVHFPRSRLICLENTHNRCGGAALTPEHTKAVCQLAQWHGLAVHLDGARIFNAAVALGVDVKELVRDVDSVQFCLSKGLSAPVGSVVCGDEEFIYQAWRNRKIVGGGMRQAGIIAAAGIVALEQMVDRLAEDHANARRLAEGLAEIPGLALDLDRVQTNIVIFELVSERLTPAELAAKLGERGVRLLAIEGRRLRAVTHYGIEADDIEVALAVVREVIDQL